MKSFKVLQIALLLVLSPLIRDAKATSYVHSLTVTNMEFHWKVEGDKLAFKVVGQTEGWVGVGFNAKNKMQGADIVIGYVEDGIAKVSDDYGNRTIGHTTDDRLGGRNSIQSYSGSEVNGVTTLECVILLDSGDKKADTIIQPEGNTTVILAYGSRDSFRISHRHAVTLNVNLATGEHKITAGH